MGFTGFPAGWEGWRDVETLGVWADERMGDDSFENDGLSERERGGNLIRLNDAVLRGSYGNFRIGVWEAIGEGDGESIDSVGVESLANEYHTVPNCW